MVSKLLLAVLDTARQAEQTGCSPDVLTGLYAAYYDVREGIGFNKAPDIYGAFPTDPYSHTPGFAGARQPGMTGQVKEDILSRFYELGLRIEKGIVSFDPSLMRSSELLVNETSFQYLNVSGEWVDLALEFDQFAFTLCQVPVVYRRGDACGLKVVTGDGETARSELTLTAVESRHLFSRDSIVERIEITFPFSK